MKQEYALYVFLCAYNDVIMAWKHFPHHPPFVERINQSSAKETNSKWSFMISFVVKQQKYMKNSRVTGDMRHGAAKITLL